MPRNQRAPGLELHGSSSSSYYYYFSMLDVQAPALHLSTEFLLTPENPLNPQRLLNPYTLNPYTPKPLNPYTLNPGPLNPKPLNLKAASKNTREALGCVLQLPPQLGGIGGPAPPGGAREDGVYPCVFMVSMLLIVSVCRGLLRSWVYTVHL